MGRSIRLKLVAVYLLLILFALELIGAYFVRSLNASLIRNDTQTVLSQAKLLATIAAPEVAASAKGQGTAAGQGDKSGNPAAQSQSQSQSQPSSQSNAFGIGGSTFTSILSSFPQFNGTVYLLNASGVVEESSAGAALIGQKRTDSVATEALVSHNQAVAIRFDPLSGEHLLVVAVPMFSQHKFLGVVENVVPIQNTYTTVRQVTTIFYTSSAVVLLLTAVLGIILSRTITKPVLDVTRQARSMAAGDFSQRVMVQSDDEFGDLGNAVNDLTDKLEAALAENLRERERLRAIIKYMGEGLVVFDSDFNTTFSNDAALRLLASHESKDDSKDNFAELLGLNSSDKQDRADFAFVREFGDSLLHVHVTAIMNDGQLEGYVALLRDVTEQEKLNQSQRDFVANVSHELRTPLTSITSYLEALQEEAGDDADTRKRFLSVVEQETKRMVRLSQDLLQLSGLETKNAVYSESEVDVVTWIQESIQRFDLQAKAQGVHLGLGSTDSAVVKGDRDLLDRLLDNLISNALKYTADGGRVVLSAQIEGDEVYIWVSDTGIGIPEEDLPHVFERFYRVDKGRSRRRGGTGLGLALAREITERHGGHITIQSTVGRGTVVTVSLPLWEVENNELGTL